MKTTVLSREKDRVKMLGIAYENWVSDFRNGEVLFLLGFAVYMFRSIMLTTMFTFPGILSAACLGITILFIGLKIVLFDTYTRKMLIAVIAIFFLAGVIYINSGYFSVMIWLLIVVGAKDVSFDRLLEVYLLLNISIFVLTVCASFLNLVENLVYYASDEGIRNSFGYIYVTDFAAHVFFCVLIAFYLGRNQLRWFHYVLTCALAGVVFAFCKAKLDTTCIVITVLLFGIHNILKRQSINEQPGKKEVEVANDLSDVNVFKWTKIYFGWKKIWMRVGVCIMPILTMLALILAYQYNPSNEMLVNIDEFSTGRVSLSNMGLKEYGVKLFGQDVPMVGFGGTTEWPKDYFFIDCSYLNILLRYGLVFLVFVLLAYSYICIKNKDNTEFLFLIIILSISSIIDHHLLETAYNPFGFALFAHTKIKQLKI